LLVVLLYNEKDLLLQIAAGNEAAFVTIFHHYQDHIFKVAYQFVKSHAQAEELVQDIFIKVWEGREKLPALQSFQNWLFIISRNYFIDHLKRMAMEKNVRLAWTAENPLHENSTDYTLRKREFTKLLQEAVASLPAQQQAVFRLAREEYFTYDQIAKRLSISPNTVRIHMSKALAKIRDFLKEKGVEFILLFAFFNTF